MVFAIFILNFVPVPSLALDKIPVNWVNFVRAEPMMHEFRTNMKAPTRQSDNRPFRLIKADGWHCAVRMNEPREEILHGSWTFPNIMPVG